MERKKKINQEEFIKRSKLCHTEEYDYSKVNYIDYTTKVCIICKEHGEFWQRPDKHLRGQGCPKCGAEKCKRTMFKNDKETFFRKAKEKFGDYYDLSKVNYIDAKTKVEIICPIHGSF